MNMLNRICAFILLLPIAPFLALFLLAVYLEDGGPVIFKQKRVGQNGREFTFYKIRTMKRNAPQKATKDLHDIHDYVLKTGYWYRKFSIDELPNLFNIIKGDMNFIGPRPLLASELEIQELREKYGIYALKPGLTGYAQVNGRDIISDHRKIVLERFYLHNRTLKMDIKILLKTIIYVVKTTGVRA